MAKRKTIPQLEWFSFVKIYKEYLVVSSVLSDVAVFTIPF